MCVRDISQSDPNKKVRPRDACRGTRLAWWAPRALRTNQKLIVDRGDCITISIFVHLFIVFVFIFPPFLDFFCHLLKSRH